MLYSSFFLKLCNFRNKLASYYVKVRKQHCNMLCPHRKGERLKSQKILHCSTPGRRYKEKERDMFIGEKKETCLDLHERLTFGNWRPGKQRLLTTQKPYRDIAS
jgi:hypothetical protein